MVADKTRQDEILTLEQVAKLLKLHRRTIYNLVRNGTLPGRRVGRSWRFLRSEIMKFLLKTETGVIVILSGELLRISRIISMLYG